MRRRAGESLLIGGEIEIEILEVGPTRVKLGIVAPTSLSITRKEVALTRTENLTAARKTAPEMIAWLSQKLAPQLTKENCQSLDVPGGGDKLQVPGPPKNSRRFVGLRDMEE